MSEPSSGDAVRRYLNMDLNVDEVSVGIQKMDMNDKPSVEMDLGYQCLQTLEDQAVEMYSSQLHEYLKSLKRVWKVKIKV